MTSTPITAGAGSFFAGVQAAPSQTGKNAAGNFSDVLKKEQGGRKTAAPDNGTTKTETDRRSDRVSDKIGKTSLKTQRKEVSPKEAASQAEKAAETAAGEMVTKVSEELGMTEEEVMEALAALSMTPMDLLQPQNLQTLVMAISGEQDVCSLVTDEALFTTFKNLTAALEDVVAEAAEATGMEVPEVKSLLAELSEKLKTAEAPEEGMTEEMPETETAEEIKTPHTAQREETPKMQKAEHDGEETDGSKVMLERSLNGRNAGEAKNQDMTGQNAPNPFVQNPFVQNHMTAENVAEPVPFFDTDTEMILNQITDYMKSQVTDGVSEIEMQLHPESLGNVHVHLTAKEGALTAQFTAQNEVVKAALESQMVQLKETFKEQGVTVEAIEVTVESHKFEQSYDDNGGSAREENRQTAKTGRRKLNLNLLEDLAEEDLTAEEQLAAEMLKESGGTVDYTA